MKKLVILNACLAMSLATFAQNNAEKESKDNSLTKSDPCVWTASSMLCQM